MLHVMKKLIFKGLTAWHLYMSFGVKGLNSTLDKGELPVSCANHFTLINIPGTNCTGS
jgi:hypothetical protein